MVHRLHVRPALLGRTVSAVRLVTVVTHRLVATFPLNGDLAFGGYLVQITEDERGEFVHGLAHFTVTDADTGRVVFGCSTFHAAVAYCLGRSGWGDGS